MGAEGEFAELAVQYMQVYALCSPVTTIVFAMDNFLRICGFIRGSMFLNILMSGLSALLEFLFLFVFGWGVWAAALATCTGMIICAIPALVPFVRKKGAAAFSQTAVPWENDPSDHRLRQSDIFEQYRRKDHVDPDEHDSGAPWRGDGGVSVRRPDVYRRVYPAAALRTGAIPLQPAVGYNWGAGKLSRVRSIEKCCFSASAVVALAAFVLILIFRSRSSLCS